MNYQQKFQENVQKMPFHLMRNADQLFLQQKAEIFFFGHQDLRMLINIGIDLKMWGEKELNYFWPDETKLDNFHGKVKKKKLLEMFFYQIDLLKRNKSYTLTAKENLKSSTELRQKIKVLPTKDSLDTKILGRCPVASDKTLCCQLMTLDAVQNCGQDCSYCSIQTFYSDNKIFVEGQLLEKLKRLKLDPNEIYHIGTGQASDSLMWGNLSGILDNLLDFAKNNPNVILELKTKSSNIGHLLKVDIPKNVICTWSLNPDEVIQNEEHYTANLDQRLQAARLLANRGVKVGFHFHPIIYFEGHIKSYQNLSKRLLDNFSPQEVVLVSMGTLTFTSKVISTIRSRDFNSKILQMPLVDAAGKFSYPREIKLELFQNVYQSLLPWHKKVFFYLCMEDASYWPPVFGHSYQDNLEFEKSMKNNYLKKIYG